MSVFGPLVHAGVVEAAVKDTLETWFDTYLREIERQYNRDAGSLPAPRSYRLVSETDDPVRWPEDQLPAVVILCPGFGEEPDRQGTGKYRVRYAVSVAVMVSAKDQGSTRQLARLYGTAAAAILLQNSSLDDFSAGVYWVDESFDDIDFETQRSLACAIEGFTVDVESVIDASQGPTTPVDPGEEVEWTTAEEVLVDVDTVEEFS